jgi:hypothetical protein
MDAAARLLLDYSVRVDVAGFAEDDRRWKWGTREEQIRAFAGGERKLRLTFSQRIHTV